MKMPPYAVTIGVARGEERSHFHLWLPLFLLWPLVLVFVVLTLIVTVVVDICRLLAGARKSYTRLVIACLAVLGETRGTEVFVQDKGRTVAVTVR
jgi:hypothetical protein